MRGREVRGESIVLNLLIFERERERERERVNENENNNNNLNKQNV